jgi:hypothetical protein
LAKAGLAEIGSTGARDRCCVGRSRYSRVEALLVCKVDNNKQQRVNGQRGEAIGRGGREGRE